MIDYKRRLQSLQEKMEKKDLDIIVLGAGPDFQYVTGADLDWRRFRDLKYQLMLSSCPLRESR